MFIFEQARAATHIHHEVIGAHFKWNSRLCFVFSGGIT